MGVWGGPGSRLDASMLSCGLRALAHRGPDDFGALGWSGEGAPVYTRDPAQLNGCSLLLGHRRLSILDLSAAGWQPMATPDGRYAIVFNGEIYNFVELRSELEAAGQSFRSGCDTEVLLGAYALWGRDMLARLVGMFAFAVLDTKERRLFLARDCFGIKPLYYTRWNERGFAFASEIKALLQLPGMSRAVNPIRLQEYLLTGRTDHGDATLFSDVRQLPPGHCLVLPLDGGMIGQPECYWMLDPEPRSDLTFDQAASHLRELFLDNVRLHLRSDVPVGAALSGGIDSSAIVAAMRHVEPDLPLHTFTYVADDPRLSEQKWADLVTRSTDSVPHLIRATPGGLQSALDQLISVQDEPFASTSIYAQYRVFEAAGAAGMKVMLDGQGADELLAGYWPYVLARLGSLARSGRWADAATLARASAPAGGTTTARLLARTGGMLLPAALRRRLRRRTAAHSPPWMSSRWFGERSVQSGPPPPVEPGRDMLRRNLIDTVQRALPALLRYEDRNSMASSIESRVPFLTRALAEFVLSLPEEYVLSKDGTSKAVFRAAMRGIVPDPVLDRRDKIGFATPEADWLLRESAWVDAVLGSDAARAIPALDLAEVGNAWKRSKTSGRVDPVTWRQINLIRWSEINDVQYN